MKRVAVLGGGGTGCCFAAALALRGFEVCLFEQREYWHEHIDGILRKGGLEVTGQDVTGTAQIAEITDDLQKAVGGVDTIFVCMVAWRHQWLADSLKPLLKAGQTVILSAGNFGSIRLKRTFGMDSPVVVGEMLGNIFPCRMIGEGKAVIAFPYGPKKVAAFPAKDNDKVVAAMGQFLECSAAKNVFETALNVPNLVCHLAGSVLNTCAIDRNPAFALYADGLSEHVIEVQMAVEREKEQVIQAMGFLMVNHTDLMKQLVQYDQYPEKDDFRHLAGPGSMDHRYIVEDSTVGQSVIIDLAERLGLDMPVMKALVLLASVINRRDFRAEGLKLDDLGMAGLRTAGEINAYLYNGFAG